ncbi:hypothetical protein EW026_g2105 [Hermanssonia centrifuga]|uniref:Uncharacterized protein n=1 Tax=Hermanssonia centrifuga TaxID=98765 RepID=A0A4S4KQ12_9APHY|nr:hypothetical protein EW026_g2105 [Hermanssonia centrifuga]
MARTHKSTQKENPTTPLRRAALTNDQKARRRQKFLDLKNDLTGTQESWNDATRKIAEKYGRTERWTQRQLMMGMVKKPRKPNAWNGFIKEKHEEANEGYLPGGRLKLPEFISENAGELKEEYERLTPDEKEEYRERLAILREDRTTTVRANPKAVQAEVQATFGNLKKDHVVAQDAKGSSSLSAVALKTSMCPSNVGAETHVRGAVARFNKAQAVSSARSSVQEGFNMILRHKDVRVIRKGKEKEIKMNYDNYEAKIVEKYGVALVGYPCKLVNPGNLGRTDLESVIAAFKDGTCRWEKLSASQLKARIDCNHARQAAGEQIYKARKGRSRTQKGNPKSSETIDSGDDEGIEDGASQARLIGDTDIVEPETNNRTNLEQTDEAATTTGPIMTISSSTGHDASEA